MEPWSAIIKNGVELVTKTTGSIIDKAVTNDAERAEAKAKIADTTADILRNALAAQQAVLLSELNGNKLQRNWRPIVALSFGFIVFASYFLFPLLNIWLNNAALTLLINDLKANHNFWQLMEVMVGGYAIGRTAEKIAENFANKSDLILLRKKDRKEALKNE